MDEMGYWQKCGPCKKPLAFGSLYYRCSVSTCRKNAFCSKDCWSAHVPIMRHKDAWPEEAYAPQPRQEEAAVAEQVKTARRRVVVPGGPVDSEASGEPSAADGELASDILIVASKLKQYIKAKSQMSTSAQVMNRLSDIVRICCDQAIERARQDGRKTVLERDFIFK